MSRFDVYLQDLRQEVQNLNFKLQDGESDLESNLLVGGSPVYHPGRNCGKFEVKLLAPLMQTHYLPLLVSLGLKYPSS